MERTLPLYVMLSRTGTTMGKTVRLVTRYGYNHVSVTLDPSFQSWVSFARHVRDIPLAGGFVKETPVRFCATSGPLLVKIYRFDIPESRCAKLAEVFSKAGTGEMKLIYNTYSALGMHFSIPGAYTCLDFVNLVLGKQYRSLRQLDLACTPRLVFAGDLKPLLARWESEQDTYLTRHSPLQVTRRTAGHFARLTWRAIYRHRYSDPLSSALK